MSEEESGLDLDYFERVGCPVRDRNLNWRPQKYTCGRMRHFRDYDRFFMADGPPTEIPGEDFSCGGRRKDAAMPIFPNPKEAKTFIQQYLKSLVEPPEEPFKLGQQDDEDEDQKKKDKSKKSKKDTKKK